MKRRELIKILGAGAGAAVAPSWLAGCSSSLRATEAWNGPRAGEDDIRWIVISYAILAPNAHNKQPWVIKLTGPRSFELYVDRGRLLPETDPPSRQIHISQGTFLENLELAARQFGFRAAIVYFPKGEYGENSLEDRPVASIELVPDASVARDPLFEQILKRQSNKRPYQEDRTPAPGPLRALTQACGEEFPLTIVTDRSTRGRIADVLIDAMQIEVAGRSRHAETISMFRFNDDEIERHRDGFGLAQSGVTGFEKWFIESFILSRDSALPADSSFGEGTIDLTEKQARSASAFGVITSTSNTRLDQVKVGRAYERVALTAAAGDIAMHPMSQVLQEYPDMAELQGEFRRFLKVPTGVTVQMLFRLGHADPVEAAPRRSVVNLVAS